MPAEEPALNARRAVIAAFIGYALVGFDFLILNYSQAAIRSDLQVNEAQLGSLIFATFLGALIGGIVFGMLADRLGRVRVLSWTILLFALCSGLCALARELGELLIARTLAGAGLGGEIGIGMALAMEACPPAWRARAASIAALGWPLGGLLAALAASALLPAIGWRGLFLLGILPAIVAVMLRRRIAEPGLFSRRAALPRPRLPITLLLGSGRRRLSLALVILCAVHNFGFYGVMSRLPRYLVRAEPPLTRTLLWGFVTTAGICLGIWVFGLLADRIGRRRTFFVFQFGAALAVLVDAQIASASGLILFGAVAGFFVSGMLGGYFTLMAELYPTEVRATAMNTLFCLGRLIFLWAPPVIGMIYDDYSLGAVVAFLIGLYALALLVTALLIPERRGAPLEEPAKEPEAAKPAPAAMPAA